MTKITIKRVSSTLLILYIFSLVTAHRVTPSKGVDLVVGEGVERVVLADLPHTPYVAGVVVQVASPALELDVLACVSPVVAYVDGLAHRRISVVLRPLVRG